VTGETVSRAAIESAGQSGIESLIVRILGQELGVEAMSLCNHVASKDDIPGSIVDLVVSEIGAPGQGAGPQIAVRQRAILAHQVLVHRWAVMLIMPRFCPTTGPVPAPGGRSAAVADERDHSPAAPTARYSVFRVPSQLPFDLAGSGGVDAPNSNSERLPKDRPCDSMPHLSADIGHRRQVGGDAS
jgi:hypothetical protein